jgi:plasmid stability protein
MGVGRAIDSEGDQGAAQNKTSNATSILLSGQLLGSMNTLVLRRVPDALYRRLKAVAASHRRSMNQEAILALEAGLPGQPAPSRPTAEESRRWLEEQVWTLPLLDERSADDILGYGDDGLCG